MAIKICYAISRTAKEAMLICGKEKQSLKQGLTLHVKSVFDKVDRFECKAHTRKLLNIQTIFLVGQNSAMKQKARCKMKKLVTCTKTVQLPVRLSLKMQSKWGSSICLHLKEALPRFMSLSFTRWQNNTKKIRK